MSKFTADELIEHVYDRTGATNDDVIVGPGPGEDAAAIEMDGETAVVSSDPISMASDRLGQLGVTIATNTVAAAGGDPEWLTTTILLPRHDADLLEEIMDQIDETARDLDQAIVGGHSESVVGVERPLVSVTAMGTTEEFVSTDGATPGDHIVLTKAAGIEATGVLATDYREEVEGVGSDVIDRAEGFFDEVSVIPEAGHLGSHANAMHDPTEGGVLAGLTDMALAADVTIEVDRADIPVRSETETLCQAAGIDPLRVLCSGGLLAAVPPAQVDAALASLDDAGIEATTVGRVREGETGVRIDGEQITEPPRDELYELIE